MKNWEKELRYQIKDAIRYVGTSPKTSGGWVDEITEPIVDDIVKRIKEKVLPEIDGYKQGSSDRQAEIYKRLVKMTDDTYGVASMTDVFALFVELRKEHGDMDL